MIFLFQSSAGEVAKVSYRSSLAVSSRSGKAGIGASSSLPDFLAKVFSHSDLPTLDHLDSALPKFDRMPPK
jgi:hypothetical protein